MSPAVKGSKIMASPMRMRTAAADSAMGGETTGVVSSGPRPGLFFMFVSHVAVGITLCAC